MQYKSEKSLYLRKILGKTIKDLREKETGLSGNKFANEYELGNGNLSRIENAVTDCKVITAWRIAEALGLKLSDLIKRVENSVGNDFKLTDE